ncbi:MAG: type III effector [Cycloclasticus sp.]|nr:type III effector [Cycloclasticus sp.]MBG95993.1 type III effector [Cycloclasticus sp.]|tara:strand:- start:159 stop:497 length:339 start_codon:yes stop_codon:yes gene_type:complete
MKNSIEQLRQALATLQFNETMEIVEALYDFTPTGFTNGDTRNEAGENNGSCKLFAFAKIHDFTEAQTLALFGEHYRNVLATPDGDDHQNIRNFMKTGWAGITFDGIALVEKT